MLSTGRERTGLNAGRVTEDLVEGQEVLIAEHDVLIVSQEVLITHWMEINADGNLTEVEQMTFTMELVAQSDELRRHGIGMRDLLRSLLAFDVAVKWVVRTVRRGFSAENDRKRISDERNLRAVLTDPYGTMAAD